MSASEIILEYVCPAAGVVTGNLMFFSPFRDARRATRREDYLGPLNPTPWAFMLGNCCGWVIYSMLKQDLFIFFANAPGFILSVYLNMVAVKLQYARHRSNEMRESIVGVLEESTLFTTTADNNKEDGVGESQSGRHLVRRQKGRRGDHDSSKREPADVPEGHSTTDEDEEVANHLHDDSVDPRENRQRDTPLRAMIWNVATQKTPAPAPHERLVLGMVIVWTAIAALLGFGGSALGVSSASEDSNDEDDISVSTAELVVGLVVNLNLVVFYGAPLSTIFQVLNTKSSETIHIPTMVTCFANGVFWCAYGIAIFDFFIIIPNGLGALLGGIQFFLCLTFPRKAQARNGGDSPPQQLGSAASCSSGTVPETPARERDGNGAGGFVIVEPGAQ